MGVERSNSDQLAVYWAQHQPVIAGYINSLVSNFQDADDILQNVAVVTVKNFAQYDPEKSFAAWAIGIARNLVLKYYAEKKKDRQVLHQQAILAISQAYENDFKTICGRNESMKTALDRCLKQVKGRWRKVLEMYYLRELSAMRIAQQLGITKSNVCVSLHRVRLALRECVENQLQQEQG